MRSLYHHRCARLVSRGSYEEANGYTYLLRHIFFHYGTWARILSVFSLYNNIRNTYKNLIYHTNPPKVVPP